MLVFVKGGKPEHPGKTHGARREPTTISTHIWHQAGIGPGACFSKGPETFRARKGKAKFRTLWLQSLFIHLFLIWTEFPFIQEVSGVFISPFLDTDELKISSQARKVSGALEKLVPGPYWWEANALNTSPSVLPKSWIIMKYQCLCRKTTL